MGLGVGWNAPVVDTLLNKAPFAAWFTSADTMATGTGRRARG